MTEINFMPIIESDKSVLIIDENNLQFNRKNIELLNKVIKHVDRDDTTNIDLFCYSECGPSSSIFRQQCRGVAFDNDTQVANGLSYTHEYTELNNIKDIHQNISPILSNCSVFDSYEGSLIRMFHHRDKWYTSTNRKLDAFKSKWVSKESFGSILKTALENEFQNNERLKTISGGTFNKENDNAIEKFQLLLDKNKQYMFLLLRNDENRIVCSSTNIPTVYHVGTFENSELNMDNDIYIPYPKRHDFSNINELFEYVRNIDYTKIQGVIIFAPNNFQYKIFNEEYYELYKVRGNEPSIKFRYLQVRMITKYNDLLRKLYPNFIDSFDNYEKIIKNIANDILQAYIKRFIKKNFVEVPVEEFQVIKNCHAWHIDNRIDNKINFSKVLEVLNLQPATNINKMIRHRISSEKIVTKDLI